MENPTQLQLMQAAVFFSAGIAVGLVYDVCRAVRRCSGYTVQTITDVIFVCMTAAVLFVLGMLVGNGQLRIFMIGCLCLGAAGYSMVCSGVLVPILCAGMGRLKRVVRVVWIPLRAAKKIIKMRKNLFPKCYVWSRINGYSFNMRQFVFKRTRREREAENNHETNRMDGLHRDRCNGNLRRVEYSGGTASTDQGRGIPRGTDGTDRSARLGK